MTHDHDHGHDHSHGHGECCSGEKSAEGCDEKGSCCLPGCCKGKCCGKLMKIAGTGLMLWGIGYGINGIMHAASWWGSSDHWYLVKMVFFRFGYSFAAILFAGICLGCTTGDCCCPSGKCCKEGECKTEAKAK